MNRKYIYLILLVIWLVTVFAFSHEPSDESSSTSGKTIRAVIDLVPSIRKMKDTEKEEIVKSLQPIARKLAHFTLYTIGGVISALYINEYSMTENKKIAISILIGFLYSISDEIHQIFVPGRAGEIRDVVIDTLGVILGVTLVWIVIKLKNRGYISE